MTPVMVLPVGETVRLRLTSTDVIHSFYVPAFLFKRDVIPGLKNQFDITVREGRDVPWLLRGVLRAGPRPHDVRGAGVSPSAYRDWVRRKQAAS